jgi:hypothetical protein
MALVLALALGFASPAAAIQRRIITEINTDALIKETQVQAACPGDCLGLVWWIPQEFWQATMGQDPTADKKATQPVLDALRPFSLVAVCQADISPMGAFTFYQENDVRQGLRVMFSPGDGPAAEVTPLAEPPAEVGALIGYFKPLLKAAMGQMGEHFHFFVLPNENSDGGRMIDPYKKQKLEIELTRSTGEKLPVQIEMPLDSLHVPRKCPNGKDAHISWAYCPWTGKKLKD